MTPRQALALSIDMFGHIRCLAWSLGVPLSEAAGWREVPAAYVEQCAEITGIPACEFRVSGDLFDG